MLLAHRSGVMQNTFPDAAHRAHASRSSLVRHRLAALALAALASLAPAACGSGGGDTAGPGGPVADVTVDPASLTLIVGKTARLGAVLHDAGGNVLRGRTVFWASSNTDVATVTQDGVVTGVDAGSVQIAANAEGKSGLADVDVSPGGPASVAVDPTSATVLVGQTTQFRATVRDALGNVLAGAVTWASNNSAVARISSDGVVTGISPGSATITASREGVSGSATVTVQLVPVARVVVSPATATLKRGNKKQFSATAYDAAGKVITGRAVTWSSSNTGVATVSSTGIVTAVKAGTATITATVSGVGGTASVTVN
jgi:uncharacterized protein YjdB